MWDLKTTAAAVWLLSFDPSVNIGICCYNGGWSCFVAAGSDWWSCVVIINVVQFIYISSTFIVIVLIQWMCHIIITVTNETQKFCCCTADPFVTVANKLNNNYMLRHRLWTPKIGTCVFRTCVFYLCVTVLAFSILAFSTPTNLYLRFPYLHIPSPVLMFSVLACIISYHIKCASVEHFWN